MNYILPIFDPVKGGFHLVKSERRPQTRPWLMQTQEDAVISLFLLLYEYIIPPPPTHTHSRTKTKKQEVGGIYGF